MEYVSTRGAGAVNLADALATGLAPDGGLYVPRRVPVADPDALPGDAGLSALAAKLLAPYAADSPLAPRLQAICRESLDLPLPLTAMEADAWILELFHGPTAAFKDFAARFLAAALAALRGADDPPLTVMVATSGDTGAAVAAAFHERPGFRVVLLYPQDRVSPRQAHQLGAFGNNVEAFRVAGTFDDCQRLVRQALNDPELGEMIRPTSANSISIGRLLPQISYYAWAALRLGTLERPLNVIVPTGNLGNALACVLAREMGLAIGEIHLATNANRTLSEYFAGGEYRGRPGLETLANAMDVGDPGNFERLAWLFRKRNLRDAGLFAERVDDAGIRACIRREYRRHGRILCPHTACAAEVLHRRRTAGDRRPFLIAATAHPAKFETVVEPVIGRSIPPPPELAACLARKSRSTPLAADYAKLRSALIAADR